LRENDMKLLIHTGLAFLLGALPLPAVTVLDPADTSLVSDSDYRALGNEFAAVGMVSTNVTLPGSGVLIGDRWVLTAGHAAPGFAGSGSFRVGGTTYAASRFIPHPDYNYSFSVRPHDLLHPHLPRPVKLQEIRAGKAISFLGSGFQAAKEPGKVGVQGRDAHLPCQTMLRNLAPLFPQA